MDKPDGRPPEHEKYSLLKHLSTATPDNDEYPMIRTACARHWTIEDCKEHEKMGFHGGWASAPTNWRSWHAACNRTSRQMRISQCLK